MSSPTSGKQLVVKERRTSATVMWPLLPDGSQSAHTIINPQYANNAENVKEMLAKMSHCLRVICIIFELSM